MHNFRMYDKSSRASDGRIGLSITHPVLLTEMTEYEIKIALADKHYAGHPFCLRFLYQGVQNILVRDYIAYRPFQQSIASSCYLFDPMWSNGILDIAAIDFPDCYQTLLDKFANYDVRHPERDAHNLGQIPLPDRFRFAYMIDVFKNRQFAILRVNSVQSLNTIAQARMFARGILLLGSPKPHTRCPNNIRDPRSIDPVEPKS
jgi:hypothetical protein